MKFNLYDNVELIENTGSLVAGAHGNVVELYDGGRIAEVEFMDEAGDTIAVAPLDVSLLRSTANAARRPVGAAHR